MEYLIKKGKIILNLQNRMSCRGDKRIDMTLKDEISSLKSFYLSLSNINLSLRETCHPSTSCCRYTRRCEEASRKGYYWSCTHNFYNLMVILAYVPGVTLKIFVHQEWKLLSKEYKQIGKEYVVVYTHNVAEVTSYETWAVGYMA